MAIKLIMIKLLVDTAYQGAKRAGDEFGVPEDFAKRWAKNRIAEITETIVDEEPEVTPDDNLEGDGEPEVIDPEVIEPEIIEPDDTTVGGEPDQEQEKTEEEVDVIDYSGLNAKELYALCKERNIIVEPKKDASFYIECLTQVQ